MRIETERLLLRAPEPSDADAVFKTYAGDPAIGKYLSWPVHRSVADTHAFIDFSKAEWRKGPAGPFLITDLSGTRIVGSTGLAFESRQKASTGYVIAPADWGMGFATEATRAMVRLARSLGVRTLVAQCHPDHLASQRVLVKAGFDRHPMMSNAVEFPNMRPGVLQDVLEFTCHLPSE